MRIALPAAVIISVALGIGSGLLGNPSRAQDNQSAPAWVMQGCRALLANPASARQPGDAAPNARVSSEAQAETCLSSAQSIMTVGSLSGAFCPPNGTSAMDAVGIIVRYIDAHQGSPPGSFRDLATQALVARWPC